MSSAVISTSAAQGRPFVFDGEEFAPLRPQQVCPQPTGAELFSDARPPQRVVPSNSSGAFSRDARLASVTPASRLAAHPAPEMVSTGIAVMDALTGGLPRGCLTEICGPASSGRTTLLLSALAAATQRGEFCAVVDAGDALDPQSVSAAGIELDRMLWVRCGEILPQKKTSATRRKDTGTEKNIFKSDPHHAGHRHAEHCYAEKSLEQLLRVADLLLESGGFGVIALDLGDLPPQTARRIPLTTWFRFRRAVEHTPTVLLAIERQSTAGSCSSLLLKLGSQKMESQKMASSGNRVRIQRTELQCVMPTHAQLLTEMEIRVEIVRSRLDRKPVRSAEIAFAGKTAWAG